MHIENDINSNTDFSSIWSAAHRSRDACLGALVRKVWHRLVQGSPGDDRPVNPSVKVRLRSIIRN